MGPAADNRPARVALFGGGIAALELLLGLQELAGDRVEVQVVAPNQDFVYAPLSVAAPFTEPVSRRLGLSELVHRAGGDLLHDSLAEVEPERQVARTASGLEIPYDVLALAIGARAEEAVPGALCFDGPMAVERYRELVGQIERGEVSSVAFTLPSGTGWGLPLYELALLTAAAAREHGVHPTLTIVTPEADPLEAFGAEASRQITALLADAGVALVSGAAPREVLASGLATAGAGVVAAERVVAMPRLVGRDFPGLPHDHDGFLPVDKHGRVQGLERVYAAGDTTTHQVKQGGLAAQQAEAVAESVAKWAGAPVRPTPFAPSLRGVLLTGDAPRFLRTDSGPEHRRRSLTRLEPMWWPPAKVAGRRLAPFLAALGVGLVQD